MRNMHKIKWLFIVIMLKTLKLSKNCPPNRKICTF